MPAATDVDADHHRTRLRARLRVSRWPGLWTRQQVEGFCRRSGLWRSPSTVKCSVVRVSSPGPGHDESSAGEVVWMGVGRFASVTTCRTASSGSSGTAPWAGELEGLGEDDHVRSLPGHGLHDHGPEVVPAGETDSDGVAVHADEQPLDVEVEQALFHQRPDRTWDSAW